ncbi:transporter [Halioglobus maricola]|uniref:Transporter n=1 Tax=Halioglobus maricola TaxID=2601894 RepID=A0A5P9NPP0_9GAMM|nr:transporter [Halioglobus maricola]QFU76868.1 transporter [Halioglobus maricola]
MQLKNALKALLISSLASAPAVAQELEPRTYTNLPVGETFIVAGYIYSEGDLSPVPGSPLQDAELSLDTGILGAAHTFEIAGSSAKVDAVIGRSCYEGSAIFQGVPTEGRRCEYTDSKLRLGWNFYGAPALKLKEFRQWQPGLVLGASLQISAPTGSYDSDQLINAGANRWMVRPGLGMSYRLGKWHFDTSASVRFYETNTDFFDGNKREQDPLYSAQAHIVRGLGKGRWVSVNLNYFWGGKTTLNGDTQDDRQDNSRFGITYSQPLTPHHSIKLYANSGVITRIGNDFDTYGFAWQYRF